MGINRLSKRLTYKLLGALFIIIGLVILLPLDQEQAQDPIQVEAAAEDVVMTTVTTGSLRVNKSMALESGSIEQKVAKQESPVFLDPATNFIHSLENPGLENPLLPDRIIIPAIKLDAPVLSAEFHFTDLDGDTFGQWKAPSTFAAGWHPDSALLGAQGNTVINGHHNVHGEVFKELVNLEIGDEIIIVSGKVRFTFIVANRMIVPERYASMDDRIENARWLGNSDDERLTLVTCWPENTNTHRLILVARPLIENVVN